MKPQRYRLLITGGKGMLANELQEAALVYNIEYIPIDLEDVDITDTERMSLYYHSVLKDLDIHGVVHAAAYTCVPQAEIERAKAIEVNINGTKNVVQSFCWPLGVPMVYISTDYVYNGLNGGYKETDTPRPVNFYATTKYLGETYASGKEDLIIRTSFKPKTPWPHSKAFDDLFTSADYVDVIARKINWLIGMEATGIYNVGTERKSVYDLARRRNVKVKPMSRKEIKDVYLPVDISMNLDKYDKFYEEQCECDAPDCCPSR